MEIEASAVSVRFGEEQALSEVSARFAPGERALVLGWTGSGKTTLLKVLAGLIAPSEGVVLWDGRDPRTLSRRERVEAQAHLGMVFQTDALFDSLSTVDNAALPLRNRGVPRDEARTRAIEALAQVGLTGAEDRFPERLSGGMRKRAGLARALVARPQVVFADDPLSGLDPGTSAQISRLIDETTVGRTLIWASTEPPATLAFPRWLWIEEGKLAYDGPPKPSLLEEVA